MAFSPNALLRAGLAADPQGDAAALTNSGDNQTFTFAFAPLSKLTGFEARVQAAGVVSGFTMTPTANNDEIAYTAGVAVIPAAATANADTGEVSFVAGTSALTRPTAGQVNISAVIANDDGTVSVVDGVDGSGFSTNRGAGGGPPYIPPTSVELGQVRLTSDTAAPVVASEILQIPGDSQESASRPIYTVDYFTGEVTFSGPLPLIHTGDTPKQVYGKGALPQYSEIRGVDFVPADVSYSTQSTQIYGENVSGASETVGNSTFTHHTQDGITDPLLALQGEEVWFDFQQDRNRVPHILTLGRVGYTRSFGVAADTQAALTITPTGPSRNYAS